jgi:para-aminobenzoate synthetase/4-amino-4-deoxychorismate lyase
MHLPSLRDPFALLENTLAPADDRASFVLCDPVRRITTSDPALLHESLAALDEERQRGHFACGYLAYEAGHHLVDKSTTAGERSGPLLDFYVYERREAHTQAAIEAWLEVLERPAAVAVHDFRLNESRESYLDKLERIQRYITDGETYQVNFTLKYRFRYDGTALALYRALRPRQRIEYGAYLNHPGGAVLSFSPELLLRKDGQRLVAKPMKGTAPRGESAEHDGRIVAALRADQKTLAENVMIVDLIRNDLSRIAEVGSVRVPSLFDVQAFETLHQMTSTVEGRVPADMPVPRVLGEIFPCGSITGAPKIRTMEIIEELEAEPRGVYTGAIGCVTPWNDFCFSVPIRTIVTDGAGSAELGIGSGVVDESDPAAEYAECLLKARFLTGLNARFQLIESMRYEPAVRGVPAIEEHLARLSRSAAFFGFAIEPEGVRGQIERSVEAFPGIGASKVRVLLSHDGGVSVTVTPLSTDGVGPAKRVMLSGRRVDSRSYFQYHKTTNRHLYDDELARAREAGAYDALFLNERDELAEASFHNVFIEHEGELLTPPISAGILPGLGRRRLLRSGRAVERPITLATLLEAKRILLTNSVRGVVEVALDPSVRATTEEGFRHAVAR